MTNSVSRICSRSLVPVLALALVSCASQVKYQTGLIRSERLIVGPVILQRNEHSAMAMLFHPDVMSARCTWQGNEVSTVAGGLYREVNVPGTTWLIYLIVKGDAGPEAKWFGIGSGDGDLRISLLYGFLSLGRNWNIFWLNGFWWGDDDPALRKDPPPSVVDYFKSISAGG